MTIKLVYFEENDIGKRDYNQDFFAHTISEEFSCFVVADGLGGHAHGEIASKMLCEALIHEAKAHSNDILTHSLQGMQAYLEKSYELMKLRILQEHGSIDTHTTVALVWLDDSQMITAHVGDSRVYRLNSEMVLWRTPDHTAVQTLFEEGELTDDEMGKHPLQNQLLRTINLREQPDFEIFIHPPLKQAETIVLCTDGFWTDTPLTTMVQLANRKDYEMAFRERIAFLAQNPFADNITVQIVKMI